MTAEQFRSSGEPFEYLFFNANNWFWARRDKKQSAIKSRVRDKCADDDCGSARVECSASYVPLISWNEWSKGTRCYWFDIFIELTFCTRREVRGGGALSKNNYRPSENASQTPQPAARCNVFLFIVQCSTINWIRSGAEFGHKLNVNICALG